MKIVLKPHQVITSHMEFEIPTQIIFLANTYPLVHFVAKIILKNFNQQQTMKCQYIDRGQKKDQLTPKLALIR